jgi:hypothetical protein
MGDLVRAMVARAFAWLTAALLLAIASAPAQAAPTTAGRVRLPANSPDRRTGIGGSLGDPMGLSLKHFFSTRHALQADFAWLPLHHGAGGISLDYLFHSRVIGSNPDVDAVGYIGGGLGFGLWGRHTVAGYDGPHVGRGLADKPVHFGLMLRAPVIGLAFHWVRVPLDTCLEGAWSPFVLEVANARFGPAHISIAIKLRYYIGRRQ